MKSPDEYAEGRQRGGEPAHDRPEVGEYLAEIESEPVEYEGPSDIWSAEAYGALVDLCDHEETTDASDVADAIDGATTDEVRRLLDLHDLEVSAPDHGDAEETVTLPLDVELDPDHFPSPLRESDRLLSFLYLDAGLGVGEIQDVLTHVRSELRPGASAAANEVDRRDVRVALEDAGLVAGEGSSSRPGRGDQQTERERRFEVNSPQDAPDIGPIDVSVSDVDAWERQEAGRFPKE